MVTVFCIGVVIAFITSIPVGPVGFLCISRTIAHGRWAGFIGALGASLVDVLFAVIAAYSLTSVMKFIEIYEPILHGISIITITILGIYFLKTKSQIDEVHSSPIKNAEGFLASAFLNITNPFAIFSFFTLFALAGIGQDVRHGAVALSLVLGVFVGACLWWLTLCSAAVRFQHHMNQRTFTALNRGFGLLMIALSIFLLFKFTLV